MRGVSSLLEQRVIPKGTREAATIVQGCEVVRVAADDRPTMNRATNLPPTSGRLRGGRHCRLWRNEFHGEFRDGQRTRERTRTYVGMSPRDAARQRMICDDSPSGSPACELDDGAIGFVRPVRIGQHAAGVNAENAYRGPIFNMGRT